MPTVFISYRRDDTAGEAGRLADDLIERFGRSRVFIDVDSIPLATNFEDRIHAALDSCRVVFVLIGDDWLTARLPSDERRLDAEHDYLRQEVAAALERPDVAVVPVLVEGAQMPTAEDLPSDISALAKINAVDLSHKRWRADVGTLCEIAQRHDAWWSRVLSRLRARALRTTLIFILVGAIVAAGIIASVGDVFDGSSGGEGVAEQVDDIRAELQAEGLKVAYRDLQLHQGKPSHLFIASKVDAQDPTSDEVRIYDAVDGALELQLSYRPEVTQVTAASAEAGAPIFMALAFQLRTIADIDDDGQKEILGSYDANLAGEEYQRVPVLIARESGEGYLVTPLLPTASFERQVTAGLFRFDFGPAGGERSPTAWASDLLLDTRNLFWPQRPTLVTRVVGGARRDSELTLEVEARESGATASLPLYVRFWGVEMLGPTPQVIPLCLRSAGVLPQPLAVRAGSDDTEALLGKPLADAMTGAGVQLGEFIDGHCFEQGS